MRKRCIVHRLAGSSNPAKATKSFIKLIINKPVAKITMQPIKTSV